MTTTVDNENKIKNCCIHLSLHPCSNYQLLSNRQFLSLTQIHVFFSHFSTFSSLSCHSLFYSSTLPAFTSLLSILETPLPLLFHPSLISLMIWTIPLFSLLFILSLFALLLNSVFTSLLSLHFENSFSPFSTSLSYLYISIYFPFATSGVFSLNTLFSLLFSSLFPYFSSS